MPILGITWQVPEPENNRRKNPLTIGSNRKISELKYANLVVYVRNATACNIEWEIYKNCSCIWKLDEPKSSAVPHLKDDSLLTIERMNILDDIKKLKDGEKLIFRASFTYESIFHDKYESEYTLTLLRDGEDILKEENNEFKRCPWDSLIYRLFA